MKIEVKHNYEIHHPPSRLTELVSTEGGKSVEQMIADAAQGLVGLTEGFPAIVGESIGRMRDGLGAIKAGDMGGFHTIFREAFDIKGQAATLASPLLGEFAQSLCALTENQSAVTERQHDLIAVTIDAIAWAASNDVRTSDDPRAAELIADLDKAHNES